MIEFVYGITFHWSVVDAGIVTKVLITKIMQFTLGFLPARIAVCCGLRPEPIVVFDAVTRRQVCQKLERTEDIYITAAFFADSRKLAFGGVKGGCFHIMVSQFSLSTKNF